ncbi:MAG: DUF4430 domain-containing protein [Halanaerobiaceae bacterium]|jgi:hypothetical protein|nr:DUF4430 domain-containing protein [Halanaerobiaceae bacterium]
MNKSIKNKVFIAVAVLVLAALAMYLYNEFLAPEGVAGTKSVSIEILINEKNIAETFNYKTEHEFLYELMKENEEELGASFREYDFGVMLVGLMDYMADESRNEFFHISINGEDAMEGLQQIVINDGDRYTFELKKW